MERAGTIVDVREYGKVCMMRVRIVTSRYPFDSFGPSFTGEVLPPHRFAGKTLAIPYRDVVRVVETPR